MAGLSDLPVSELTDELSQKIWMSVQKKIYDNKVSKNILLHHLKQIKAQMGKVRKRLGYQNENTASAISDCIKIIDNNIKKLAKKS